MDKILVSKKEAAAALGISLRTVENLIARKVLESRRIGRRRLIPRVSLEKLARRDTPSPSREAAEVASTQSKRKGNEDAGQSPRIQPQS